MDTAQQLEETLRALLRVVSGPHAKQWRKRIERYADQVARGNVSRTSDFLAMYHQGSMGSFLDFQGATFDSHQDLVVLRDRAYELASSINSARAKLGA